MNDELRGKIQWCGKQKRGIKLVAPNENLSTAYLKKAETSLKSMNLNYQEKINDWAVDAAYYARYQALYALLQKCGITCEIHDCSIMLLRFLFADIFDETLFTELETAKEQRVNLVYYTNRLVSEEEIKKNITSSPNFVLKIEEVVSKIQREKIEEIRGKLETFLGKNALKEDVKWGLRG